VNFGQAELVTPVRSVVIPSGQAAVIDGGGQPVFEVAAYAAADDFDRWSAERDRSEDRIASTRYVSPHMTGYEDLDRHGTWQTLPEYGAVWLPARVAPDWAPYRHGHWAWVSPWGWTWVDDAPWGFAPFHYGRWVHVHDRWAWAPGPRIRRPVYAPALVAFVGGSGFSFSVHSGPAVGWFPLGWREPYRPWYRASPTYVRNVNVTHVTNVTNVTHIYRNRPDAVTVVPQQAFASRRSVNQSRFNVAQADLARAQVIQTTPAEPSRASLAPERVGQRPPAQAATREVVSVTAPAAAARDVPGQRDRSGFSRAADNEPRVRVIQREGFEGQRGERPRDPERVRERTAPQPAPQQPASSGPALVAPAAPAPAPAATAPSPIRQAAPAPAAPSGAAPAPSAAARERNEAPRVWTEPPRPRADAPRERGEGRREGGERQRERFERRGEAAPQTPQADRVRAARQETPALEAARRPPPPQREAAQPRPASPAPAAIQAPPQRQAAPAQAAPQRQAAPAQPQQPRQESQRPQRQQQREGNARPGAPSS